ncbi:DUF2845 domain-containing protein [Ideonella sp.]|uniref:DUF2845 domain-containing protein n=1 Tax=Ideonella sp. TaxID=1929293 RepID=UPI002B4727BD|nr:DUF2845 domain-containing protein [Ideonella sp.]HJV71323.1 DUF2845 domain-containing protein [Ideonella sp.]
MNATLVRRGIAPVLAALAAALAAGAPRAESLRCNGSSTGEGDSRLSVLYKCGEPLLKDSHCAPLVHAGTLQPVAEPFASALVACQPIEEWVYDRGPGNLIATVRFKAGVVQSISYGRAPQ